MQIWKVPVQIVLLSWLSISLFGQTLVNLRSQTKDVDFSSAASTKPVRVDTTLPAFCSTGDFFFRIEGSSSGRLFACITSNIWSEQAMPSPQSGASGAILVTNGSTTSWLSLGGDLTGAPNALQTIGLRGRTVSAAAPQSGQVLVWDGASWTPQSISGEGQGTITIKSGSTTVSTSGVANFIAGTGMNIALSTVGGESRIQHNVDTSQIETRGRAQKSESIYCASTSANPLDYTCAITPVPASLQTGMIINWRPDVSAGSGALTLKINTLSASPIKLADGVTNAPAGDFIGGQMYTLWYDGAVFRRLTPGSGFGVAQNDCSPTSNSATAYTCQLVPQPSSYETGMTLQFRPDIDATSGGVTLQVGSLAAIAVKLPNGASDPLAVDLRAGRAYTLWYDGAVFRMLNSDTFTTDSGTRPACVAGLRGRTWHTFGAASTADTVAVCAKDASDAYDWRTIY